MKDLPSLGRLKDVAGAFFDYEMHHLIDSLSLKKHLPIHKRFEVSQLKSSSFSASPEVVRKIFEKLGGAFIKLGQLLALRPDLIGHEYSKEFEKLLTNVPPEDSIAIKGLVKHIPFTKFNSKPLGCASIAQVHKAVLKGKTVAVKIKRPGIEKTFAEDIRIMEILAERINKKHNLPYIDPVKIVEEFKNYTNKELDFSHEAANIRKFSKNFKNVRHIKIPKVYDEYSNKSILIMEFIDGKNILDAKTHNKGVIKKVTDAVYKMLFEDRFFHADLHPGNVYINGNNVIFLDFGIAGYIDKPLEIKLFYLFSALVNSDLEKTADALLDINISQEEPNADYLRDGLHNVLGDYYDQPIGKMDFAKIFYGSIDVARKSHIKMPANLVLFGKSLVTMEGFCREIDPKFNVVKNAKPYVKKIIRKKFSPKNMIEKAKGSALELHDLAVSAPGMIKSFARKFTILEERVVNMDTTFKRLTNTIWAVGKILTLSILFVAFFLSASLLKDNGVKYYGYSLISIIFISIGAILFLELLFTLKNKP